MLPLKGLDTPVFPDDDRRIRLHGLLDDLSRRLSESCIRLLVKRHVFNVFLLIHPWTLFSFSPAQPRRQALCLAVFLPSTQRAKSGGLDIVW